MSLAINTNALANIANRSLQSSQSALAKSLNRFSSGKKINQSSEDAGGLAVSSKLEARMGRNSLTIWWDAIWRDAVTALSATNLESFQSRLMDVEVAAEPTQLAKAYIKVSLMGPSNSSPNIAITLLQL